MKSAEDYPRVYTQGTMQPDVPEESETLRSTETPEEIAGAR